MEIPTLTDKDRLSVLIKSNNSLNDIREILVKYTLSLEDMVGIIKFIMNDPWEKIDIIKMLHNEFGLDIAGNSSMFVKLIKNYPYAFMIKLLIDLGIDINIDDGKLLMISCKYKFLENIKLLLDLGVDPNIRNGKALIKTLSRSSNYASETVKLDITKLLFEYGLNNIHKDALEMCVLDSKYDIATLLVESGADVNTHNGTPLIVATSARKYKFIKLLLDYGANVNCFSNKRNQTYYWDNNAYEKYTKVHDLLVSQGVDPIVVMKFSMFNLC